MLNVALILISLVLAFLLPFSVFLISYAVLGPLHYMTEINWLNDRKFFVRSSRWIWVFVLAAAIISLPTIAHLPVIGFESLPGWMQSGVGTITNFQDILLIAMLLLAVGLIFLQKWWHIALFFAASLIASKFLAQFVLNSYILAGIFVPTLIHVYLFTLFFMLLGALNSGNRMAYAGVVLLVLIPFIILLVNIDPKFYAAMESARSIETSGNFRFINFIADLFHSTNENGRIEAMSEAGLKIQTFVAFGYTYHYLNWFSKVSIIGWRKTLSKAKTLVILTLWIGSLALFLYDYAIAYLTLFFMALLHIVLEFPLNMLSLKLIVEKVKGKVAGS